MTASTGLVYFGELPFKSFAPSPADYSGVDVSGYQWQFRFVMLDHTATNGAFVLPGTIETSYIYDSGANFPFGVLINAPKQNEAGQIVIMGETKVIANSGSITAGCPLTYTQYGFVDIASSTDPLIGFARYASTAKGDLITALILPCTAVYTHS
jgi:hypothetical protein